MRHTRAAFLGAALLALTAAGVVHADPVQWSYSWSRTPDQIDADGTTTSYLQLSDASKAVTPGTIAPIVASNVFTYGNGPSGPPAVFSAPANPIPNFVTLTIYDQASGDSGGVSFDGEIFGYFTPANDHVQTFYTGTLTKSILVGKHLYTVEMDDFAPDTADCATGHVTAIATVIVQSLPEPSAAVLGGAGPPGGRPVLDAATARCCRPAARLGYQAAQPTRSVHGRRRPRHRVQTRPRPVRRHDGRRRLDDRLRHLHRVGGDGPARRQPRLAARRLAAHRRPDRGGGPVLRRTGRADAAGRRPVCLPPRGVFAAVRLPLRLDAVPRHPDRHHRRRRRGLRQVRRRALAGRRRKCLSPFTATDRPRLFPVAVHRPAGRRPADRAADRHEPARHRLRQVGAKPLHRDEDGGAAGADRGRPVRWAGTRRPPAATSATCGLRGRRRAWSATA